VHVKLFGVLVVVADVRVIVRAAFVLGVTVNVPVLEPIPMTTGVLVIVSPPTELVITHETLAVAGWLSVIVKFADAVLRTPVIGPERVAVVGLIVAWLVIVAVEVAVWLLSLMPVAVIVAEPFATAVTSPVVAPTVAIDGVPDDHVTPPGFVRSGSVKPPAVS
jgi:hypothetical protein